MRRNKRDFGRLILIAIFLFVAVLLPNLINAISRAADTLGTFVAGETGIKLCAIINNGLEESLRFKVTNDQGFQADVVVPADTCKNIHTEAATYHVRQYVSQEYAIDSVSGGTISADDSDFVTTASGQYSIVYANSYSQKPYLHNFGYTSSATASSAVEVTFDANGGTGTMAPQYFGLNAQRTLTANAFTKAGYDFDGWNTEAAGTGTSYVDEQALTFATGGELKLYAQWAPTNRVADILLREANDPSSYTIDFTRTAIVSDDVTIANGNGVNSFTEKGQDVYYYRGEIYDNNVIWADKCWKIVRTTYTGGTKMIYNGEPTDVDGAKQCLATGTDSQISLEGGKNTFQFNGTGSDSEDLTSPADIGYMYGDRLLYIYFEESSLHDVFTFSNDVTRTGTSGNYSYQLDTSDGQSVTGTLYDIYDEAMIRYHYFCTDGSTVCDSSKIGYVTLQDRYSVRYINIGGYADIEEAKAAMFANTNDSDAKYAIESWFEEENLDGHVPNTYNYEDELEDAIFCNDREIISNSLKSKEQQAGGDIDNISAVLAPYFRTVAHNSDNNLDLSLDCSNMNDAFTESDIVNGNGKLNHKVGLMTADEYSLAGTSFYGDNTLSYLYSAKTVWTMSPAWTGYGGTNIIFLSDNAGINNWKSNSSFGLRPVVSLKSSATFVQNGADGTTTNPYIVE